MKNVIALVYNICTYKTLTHCWFDDGTPSTTLALHKVNNGSKHNVALDLFAIIAITSRQRPNVKTIWHNYSARIYAVCSANSGHPASWIVCGTSRPPCQFLSHHLCHLRPEKQYRRVVARRFAAALTSWLPVECHTWRSPGRRTTPERPPTPRCWSLPPSTDSSWWTAQQTRDVGPMLG